MTACQQAVLRRVAFRMSRLLDFASEKELVAQTGHQRGAWPLVIVKELVDNAIDACEEACVAPVITVAANANGITVTDNGPGLPADTVDGILDFSVRVSSREAYVSPTRGAQGNALKTVMAMPFVADPDNGGVEVEALGIRHFIKLTVDRIRQEPVVSHNIERIKRKSGTKIRVRLPVSASSYDDNAGTRFLQIVDDFAWLNPHLTITGDWFGEKVGAKATNPTWEKWGPSDPTSPHWYTPQHLTRLIGAYVSNDADDGRERTVREVVAEFRGLSSTAKQKAVLNATGLSREPLSRLVNGNDLDAGLVARLLAAMQASSKPIKPEALGIIGRGHLRQQFAQVGCEMESFDYRCVKGTSDGLPWALETAFGWCPENDSRRLVTGVNWSPGILNPFRELGRLGQSLDTILSQQRASSCEPVILVLHIACPRVEYTDRGKSAVVVAS
jgi:DNA topoisomerase VI subunit B